MVKLIQSLYICGTSMIIKKFISYLTFWKKTDMSDSTSINLRMMHGINKISIIMFLIALVVMIVRLVR